MRNKGGLKLASLARTEEPTMKESPMKESPKKRLSLTFAALALCAGAVYGAGALAQSGGGSYGGGTGSGASSPTPGQTNGRSGMSSSPSAGGSNGSSTGSGMGNGGRTLTMAEALAAGLTQAQFNALDTNHDGVLDEQELAKGGYRFRDKGG
jgi:hypothetical protein